MKGKIKLTEKQLSDITRKIVKEIEEAGCRYCTFVYNPDGSVIADENGEELLDCWFDDCNASVVPGTWCEDCPKGVKDTKDMKGGFKPAKTRSNYTQAVNGKDRKVNVNPFQNHVVEEVGMGGELCRCVVWQIEAGEDDVCTKWSPAGCGDSPFKVADDKGRSKPMDFVRDRVSTRGPKISNRGRMGEIEKKKSSEKEECMCMKWEQTSNGWNCVQDKPAGCMGGTGMTTKKDKKEMMESKYTRNRTNIDNFLKEDKPKGKRKGSTPRPSDKAMMNMTKKVLGGVTPSTGMNNWWCCLVACNNPGCKGDRWEVVMNPWG